MEHCEIHKEPKNITTDRYGKVCIKCYLQITEQKAKRVKKPNNQLKLKLYEN